MKYPMIVQRRAKLHLRKAFRWYEDCREGLGKDFLLCVEATLDRIRRLPELHTKVYKELRRAGVRRFPYGVFYRFEKRKIAVLAVLHDRQDSKEWELL